MEPQGRRLRGVRYLLSDLEVALNQAGRIECSRGLDAVARRIHVVSPGEFLEECRLALEEVLLGERDLPSELIGQILEAVELVDDISREVADTTPLP